jgi:hypothetical protein
MTIWLHVGTRFCEHWDMGFENALRRRGITPRKVSATNSVNWLASVLPGDAFLGRFNQFGLAVKPVYWKIAERFHWRVWPDERALYYYERKDRQASLFAALNVPHPRTAWLNTRVDLEPFLAGGITFPLVRKSPHGSKSHNVALISKPGDLDYPCLVQEYCPGNDCDYRYNCEGNRVFGSRRLVRPGDFRASGSGLRERLAELDPELVALTRFWAARLQLPSLAFDWIRHPDGRWVVTEISYTYNLPGIVADCDHYVTLEGRVEARPLDPTEYVVADFLGRL